MTITTETAPSDDAPASAPANRRWRLVTLAVLVVVGLGFAGWWTVIRDDGSPVANLPEAEPGAVGTIPPPAAAAADAEATTLLGLLEKGRALTFHATYKASGDPALLGGELTVEVWRKDGKIRQDTTLKTAESTARTAGFVIGDKSLTCSQRDDQPWACSEAPDPGTNEDGVFGSVAAELDGVDVVESNDTVGDREARCFSFPTGDGGGVMCLAPDGLPLKLSANGQELLLADVESTVDGTVFVPPADPAADASS